MNTDSNKNTTPGCSTPFKGCLIITIIIFGLFIGGLIWMLRMPGVNTTLKCRSNMEELGAAITRYKDVNNKYPEKLSDLKKEYLKDTSVLRCPLDKNKDNDTSYVYHRPGPGAKGTFVMLECDRHRPRRDMPKIKLKLLKNGTVISQTPSYKEMLKEIEEKEKKQEKKNKHISR